MIAQISKLQKRTANKLYDIIRAGARVLFPSTALTAYTATETVQRDIEGSFFLTRWIANCPLFYGNEIQKLNQANDISAKALGMSSAFLTGYLIDRKTERMFPNSPTARTIAQYLIYPSLAVIANATRNAIKEAHAHGSLESIIEGGKEKLIMHNSIQSQSYDIINSITNAVRENIIDTYHTIKTTLLNLPQIAETSDIETIANTGITTLALLSIYKLGTPLAKKAYKIARNIVNNFFVSPHKTYTQRRIEKDILKEAKLKRNKVIKNEKARGEK